MRLSTFIWLALTCLLQSHVAALVGITNYPYDPVCAFACGSSFSSFMLECSTMMHMEGHSHGGSGATTAECRANDTAYLTSLAWCIDTKCAPYDVPTWKLQKYWEEQSTTDPSVLAKWDYTTALQQISTPPNRTLTMDDTLNTTVLAVQSTWDTQYRTSWFLTLESKYESIYGIAILVTGFATPIVLTYLGYLPYMSGILDKLNPYLVYPSIFGTYQTRPLPFLLGNAPTIGQTLYIILMVILNIILTSVNYNSTAPAQHAWFATQRIEIMGLIFYRTGVFALALAPLTLLFSSRNNFLLWITNWPHSTFILLHRWVARLFALHVLLHSILALFIYKDTYSTELKQPYWQWGIVATVFVSVMLVASVLFFRRASYEIFLIVHIILAVFVIVGSWYHVKLRFPDSWGYIEWLYAVCAVWFFDRLLRVLRICKNGMRRAKITEIGDGYVRVDIPGVRWTPRPSLHAYVQFPTLSKLRPWENHPFSVLPTSLLSSSHTILSRQDSDRASDSRQEDVEKHNSFAVQARSLTLKTQHAAGITFFVRKSTGMTRRLKAQDSLLALLDGPYPNSSPSSILQCNRVILIAGGIGITGVLPWSVSHSNIKLFWSLKSAAEALVPALDGVLQGLREKEIRIGQRLDITTLLAQEAQAGWLKIGVVACGPGGLCDDVRAAVVAMRQTKGVVFELEVDAYSW